MRDILKMVQFDYITGKNLLPLVVIAFAAGTAAALLITPVIAAVLIPFAVCVFLPVQNIAARCGFNKFYGIVPIPRSTVTRAAFLEYTVSAFLGELTALLLHTIAKNAKLYLLIRQAVTNITADDIVHVIREDSAAIVVILFAVICLLVCYMRMMSDIFGHENDAKILILTAFVLFVLAMPLLVLQNRHVLPPVKDYLPQSAGGRTALVCAVHLVIFGVCALMCEFTVKKLADREL